MTAHIRVSVDRDSVADRATRKSANDIQARHGLGLLAHMRDRGFDLPLTIESDTSSAPAFLQADEAWVSEDMLWIQDMVEANSNPAQTSQDNEIQRSGSEQTPRAV